MEKSNTILTFTALFEFVLNSKCLHWLLITTFGYVSVILHLFIASISFLYNLHIARLSATHENEL